VRELVGRLVRLDGDVEYTLFVDFEEASAPPLPAGIRTVRVATAVPAERAAAAAGNRSPADLWAASRTMSRCRLDVVLFPSLHTYTPVLGGAEIAVVVHDVIPELFPERVFPTARARLFWQMKSWAARRQADLIITVSEASKRAMIQCFGLDDNQVAVAPEAAGPSFRQVPRDEKYRETLERWRLHDDRFILYVGGFSPHKNLETLIDAFGGLSKDKRWSAYTLVLAGDYEGDVFYSCHRDLRARIERSGLGANVVFTGYVSDELLVHLYNAAAVVVMPSLWEGFGLPALEAMACGTPVIASARGALPEIVGETGLLVDVEQPSPLQSALERLLADDAARERLGQAARERASTFSWDRTAAVVGASLKALATARPAR